MQESVLKSNSLTYPKINNVDTLMFFICVIDILFLPYVRVLSASLSMLLLPIWYLFNLKKIKITFEFRLFMILVFFVLLSFSVSAYIYPDILRSNITNSAIFLYGFVYYFFFKYYFNTYSAPLRRLLVMYLLFGFTLATVYLISPSFYFNIRSIWTMSGNNIDASSGLLIMHRFTSTFSDPNNASVVFVGIMAFLLLNQKTNFMKNFFIIGTTLVILISTMSTTGFITFTLVIIFYFWNLFRPRKPKGPVRFKKSILIKIPILFFILPVLLFILYKFLGSEIPQIALDRVSSNSTDSRLSIWQNLLSGESIFKYLLLGTGGTVMVDGFIYRPHNGHLHLIYSYGMIVYAIFIYLFFRIRKGTPFKDYIFLIPFFLGFTVNVGIYEFRFITLMALLTASYGVISVKNKDRLENQGG